MSKQKQANQADKPADPPATPDPVVVDAGRAGASAGAEAGDPPPPDGSADASGMAAGTAATAQAATAAGAEGHAAAGDPQAEDPPPRRPRALMPDTEAAEAISGFLADWRADTPAEAATGSYSPHARDRFAEQDHAAIPDGVVFSRGWVFVFDDGRFVGAADASQAREDVFVPKGQFVQLSAA